MRPDISEVLIERPRRGGGLKYVKGEKKLLQKTDIEELPKSEKIRQKWTNTDYCKQSTDVLGPLVGWIRKQVGRNWDDVYSEIAQNMPQSSMAKSHVRDHVFDFVTVANQVKMIDGKPYHKQYSYKLSGNRRRDEFYVNPDTNILCLVPPGKRYKYTPPEKPYKWVNEDTLHHQIEDIWYEIKVKRVKFDGRTGHRDKVFNEYIYKASDCHYGKNIIGVSKRQLNKKEIKKAQLRAA